MKLHDFLNEIFDIAAENDVSFDVGKDMFLENVNKGAPVQGQDWYDGAPGVDYAALTPHYEELVDTGEAFMEAVRERYAEIVDLRARGERDEAAALIAGD